VVLSSYERMYLYTAWRSVMLGADGIKKAPAEEAGLLRAVGNRKGGWVDASEGAGGGEWTAAVSAALKQPVPKPKEGSSLAYGYINCPLASYGFATNTLKELVKRSDATPARLAAWVASQKQVFKICGDDPDSNRNRYEQPKPVIPAPAELPATEALYWRQMQQYQLAAAAFYSEDYARAAKLFAAIGATDKHPLRPWGEYLSVRAQARAATYMPRTSNGRKRRPSASRTRRLRQPGWRSSRKSWQRSRPASPTSWPIQSWRRCTKPRAIGRSMQARLTPAQRFAELSKLLDDPRANPYTEDHPGDWRVLANDQLQAPAGEQADKRDALRASAGFIDWIQTLQQCGEYQAKRSCAVEQAHALDLWRRYAKEGNKPQARVWLLASTMLSNTLTPEQEQAALQVQPPHRNI
jgi:hypothetical protein